MKRLILLAVLVGLVAAALVIAQERMTAPAEPLVIYTGRSDQFVRPLAEKFTAQSGIPVTLHAGSATELLNKLRVEGARTSADLYLSNDAGTLQIGEDEGLFVQLPLLLTQTVPANYRGRENTWVGLSARARVLVVNTGAEGVDALDSVFDLADPKWAGKLGVTSSTNESFVAGLSVYQALVGDERAEHWLRGVRENAGTEVYAKHGAIVTDVAAGRRAVGLVNHYYVYRHLAEHPDAPIRVIVPDQGDDQIGAAWNVAGIAISRHARNKEAAEAFVAFVLSDEGQRMFADANAEYPTKTGIAADERLPDAGSIKVADLPLAELAARRDAAIELIDKVGMP
jgi:iron(III) transport system substrate-binding protein